MIKDLIVVLVSSFDTLSAKKTPKQQKLMLHHASLPTSVPKELCTVLCVVSSVTLAAVGFMKLSHFHTVLLFCQVITSVSLLLFSRGRAESRLG